jgi:hypothetical protein
MNNMSCRSTQMIDVKEETVLGLGLVESAQHLLKLLL